MAYIPPNKRASTNRKARRSGRSKVEDFPTLGSHKETEKTTLKYAAAVKTEQPKAKEEEKVEPGWVKLKYNRKTGKIERKGEPPTKLMTLADDEAWRRQVVLKNLVDKWQQERDNVTDVLDQSSPYWGMKDLRAPLSDDDYSDTDEGVESESESEMSDFSDGFVSS